MMVNNAVRGAFKTRTFIDTTVILDRLNKIKRVWHTMGSKIVSIKYRVGMLVEQYWGNKNIIKT